MITARRTTQKEVSLLLPLGPRRRKPRRDQATMNRSTRIELLCAELVLMASTRM